MTAMGAAVSSLGTSSSAPLLNYDEEVGGAAVVVVVDGWVGVGGAVEPVRGAVSALFLFSVVAY